MIAILRFLMKCLLNKKELQKQLKKIYKKDTIKLKQNKMKLAKDYQEKNIKMKTYLIIKEIDLEKHQQKMI